MLDFFSSLIEFIRMALTVPWERPCNIQNRTFREFYNEPIMRGVGFELYITSKPKTQTHNQTYVKILS